MTEFCPDKSLKSREGRGGEEEEYNIIAYAVVYETDSTQDDQGSIFKQELQGDDRWSGGGCTM